MRRAALLALAAALTVIPTAGAWTWPTDGFVTRPFVFGDDPYAGGQHRGVDIAGALGSSVRAAAAGTVSFAGSVPGRGKTVTIQTADGYSVTHVYLASVAVRKGDVVAEGAVVGTIGPSDEPGTADPHVHLG